MPRDAEIVTEQGVRYARWVGRDGQTVRGRLSEDGRRCTVTTRTLFVHYRDHRGRKRRQKVGRSERAALKKKLEIEDRVEGVKRGDVPAAALNRRNRTLTPILEEWERWLAARGRTAKHVAQLARRVEKVMDGIGAMRPVDLTAEAVEKWLAALLESGEDFRGKAGGVSRQTYNHYLAAVRQFARWMAGPARGYLAADPLVGLERLNADAARAFERRAMTDAEFWALIDTTERSPTVRRNLAGPDRAMCYLVAGFTGLRLSELARLRPGDFLSHGEQFRILLPAADQKNRKELPAFIPKAVAARLRPYLAGKDPAARLWDVGGWAKNGQASWALYRDLEAAGVPVEVQGKRLDFHSLRTFHQTSMLRKGVPLAHATRLARLSSPAVLMKHYARLGLDELSAEVEKLSPGQDSPKTPEGVEKTPKKSGKTAGS